MVSQANKRQVSVREHLHGKTSRLQRPGKAALGKILRSQAAASPANTLLT